MLWNSRIAVFRLSGLVGVAMGSALALTPDAGPAPIVPAPPVEFSIMKGDTRNGLKIQIRIIGDSLQYFETVYRPWQAPLESSKSAPLTSHRRNTLNSVMGNLPRHPPFGTCFGKGMRFYMVETAGRKFYRSLPEQAGKCYTEEPGIWMLFQDLDDLMAPLSEPDFQEYSAS